MGVSDLSPEVVVPLLRGRLGHPYRFVAQCPSTQREIGDTEIEGTTVATDHQTAGRGRLGRVWQDVPGRALLFSVLLRPTVEMVYGLGPSMYDAKRFGPRVPRTVPSTATMASEPTAGTKWTSTHQADQSKSCRRLAEIESSGQISSMPATVAAVWAS